MDALRQYIRKPKGVIGAAMLANDPIYARVADLSDLSEPLLHRLEHYFLTYKQVPGQDLNVSIEGHYGRKAAYEVVNAAISDYLETFGPPSG